MQVRAMAVVEEDQPIAMHAVDGDQQQDRDALDLMEDGRARDSTVAAFDDFIGRLSGVVQIEESTAPSPAAPPPASVDSSP